MKNKYLYVLVLIISMSSCQKYLNLEPENSTFDEVFWKDPSNISRATSGGYMMLRNALRADGSFFIFGDLVANNFSLGRDFNNMTGLVRNGGFKFNYAPYLEGSLWNWTRFYQIINQCNLIIENTSNIPDSKFSDGSAEKNALIAQARFLRAYTNFYMQRVWGDILLIKTSFKDPLNIPPIARSTQEEVLAFCIDDLNLAINDFEENGSKAFGSSGAAKALLAHIYAWKHDYINAEKFANDVINSGAFSLEDIDDYKNIWKGGSQEAIWEIPMLYSESGNEFSDSFFDVFLTDPLIQGKSRASAWSVNAQLVTEYFEETEERFNQIIGQDGYLIKYDDVKYYDPIETHRYAINNNLVLFRLADIYLLRSEAYLKNSKENLALIDLNVIRNRAGLDDIAANGDDLLIEIFRERRRELIGEGCTQFDLIRMSLLGTLEEFNQHYTVDRIKNQGYYWPLDMRTLLPQDELLTQNPWWRNN